jgi:hypothetical protein
LGIAGWEWCGPALEEASLALWQMAAVGTSHIEVGVTGFASGRGEDRDISQRGPGTCWPLRCGVEKEGLWGHLWEEPVL